MSDRPLWSNEKLMAAHNEHSDEYRMRPKLLFDIRDSYEAEIAKLRLELTGVWDTLGTQAEYIDLLEAAEQGAAGRWEPVSDGVIQQEGDAIISLSENGSLFVAKKGRIEERLRFKTDKYRLCRFVPPASSEKATHAK